MTSACAELAELRSAFVDGALNAADYDRLSAHLAGCDSCRRDVADLRVVHELVRGNAGLIGPPRDLSERLVSIEGSESRSRALAVIGADAAARRRVIRLRATAVTAALGAALAAVGVAGYLAAPGELAGVSDPSSTAAVEFSAALGQLPLGSDGVDGALRARRGSLTLTDRTAVLVDAPTLATGAPLSSTEVLARLRRATSAAESVDFIGQQSVHAYGAGRTYTAEVQVVSQSGRDSQINMVSQNGRAVVSDSSRAAGSSRLADTTMLTLLTDNYDLSGARGGAVAGRPATMLEASHDGAVAGRWWVDDQTGLVLWRQRVDSGGRIQLSTGFTSLQLVSRPELVRDLPRATALPTANVALTLSTTDPLSAGGWPCRDDLAGLSLLKLRADRAVDPQALHLVYSDGLSTLGVFEQRGRLSNAPPGSIWDDTTKAYVSPGAASMASWQSDDTVITVITDGSAQLLARAVADLPHEPARERTTMERVLAGWGRILATVRG